MKGWPENSAEINLGLNSSILHSDSDELKDSLRLVLIQMNSRIALG